MRPLAAAFMVLLGVVVLTAQAPATDPPQGPATEARPSFAEWLGAVKAEALTRGISATTVERALGDIPEPLPVVLERDRTQAETVLPLETYINRRLTNTLIRRGREMFSRHQSVLERVARDYGVPARIIAAIWGVESNFGAFSGTRPTIAALATLAFDPRRAAFFRRELFNALQILDNGDIEHTRMRGSWAGAMGQPQFMPSSYLRYAEDFDKDGRRDIWGSPADIFASIANYLKAHGWAPDQPWGREVRVPAAAARNISADVARRNGGCQARRDMTVALPVSEWSKLGVLAPDGLELPASDRQAALVGGKTRHFLVYDNYEALLEYNCAHAYALSVGLLASLIG